MITQTNQRIVRTERSRSKSMGWTPLVYPSSAIFPSDAPTDAAVPAHKAAAEAAAASTAAALEPPSSICRSLNQHFPLHPDVILAAVRELLILDGSIDKNSLGVVLAPKPAAVNDTASGSDGYGTKEAQISNDEKHIPQTASTSQHLRHMPRSSSSKESGEDQTKHESLTAESIGSEILRRTISSSSNATNLPTFANEVNDRKTTPRKVSDADMCPTSAGIFAADTTLPSGLFALVANGYHDVSNAANAAGPAAAAAAAQIPALVDVSISTEMYLRKKAYEMTLRMTSTFEERHLRRFLGYKSNAPKRDRIVNVMADFLFDCSHAMFAFVEEQAEREIDAAGEAGRDVPVVGGSLDQMICSDLFDEKSLKKIGGFDFSSLLPHALSIRRARANSVSWTTFAASAQGRRMLRHHLKGPQMVEAGQKRRRQRPRSRSGSWSVHESERNEKRSRSSSLASVGSALDDKELGNGDTPKLCAVGLHGRIPSESMDHDLNVVPGLIPLTINRDKGMSWGISLAKEGNMCIVDRIPSEKTSCKRQCLKVGDQIVSVRNKSGTTLRLSNETDFYGQTVEIFKSNHTLHLEIRRVCAVVFTVA